MIEEADFQKIGNATIDLCVFVDKLRLGDKHREEADKLTHNVLNLIKQTEKIKEEPLTKGNKMSKKLKIQFWKAEKALAMQILEQEGLPKEKGDGEIRIFSAPDLRDDNVFLRGASKSENLNIGWIDFYTQHDLNAYLHWAVNAITDELFTGEGGLKIGEMCEVRDEEDKQWEERKLLAILPEQYNRRFIVETEDYPTEYSSWDYARPIIERTEPTVEECGQLITYTWEEK